MLLLAQATAPIVSNQDIGGVVGFLASLIAGIIIQLIAASRKTKSDAAVKVATDDNSVAIDELKNDKEARDAQILGLKTDVGELSKERDHLLTINVELEKRVSEQQRQITRLEAVAAELGKEISVIKDVRNAETLAALNVATQLADANKRTITDNDRLHAMDLQLAEMRGRFSVGGSPMIQTHDTSKTVQASPQIPVTLPPSLDVTLHQAPPEELKPTG